MKDKEKRERPRSPKKWIDTHGHDDAVAVADDDADDDTDAVGAALPSAPSAPASAAVALLIIPLLWLWLFLMLVSSRSMLREEMMPASASSRRVCYTHRGTAPAVIAEGNSLAAAHPAASHTAVRVTAHRVIQMKQEGTFLPLGVTRAASPCHRQQASPFRMRTLAALTTELKGGETDMKRKDTQTNTRRRKAHRRKHTDAVADAQIGIHNRDATQTEVGAGGDTTEDCSRRRACEIRDTDKRKHVSFDLYTCTYVMYIFNDPDDLLFRCLTRK